MATRISIKRKKRYADGEVERYGEAYSFVNHRQTSARSRYAALDLSGLLP